MNTLDNARSPAYIVRSIVRAWVLLGVGLATTDVPAQDPDKKYDTWNLAGVLFSDNLPLGQPPVDNVRTCRLIRADAEGGEAELRTQSLQGGSVRFRWRFSKNISRLVYDEKFSVEMSLDGRPHHAIAVRCNSGGAFYGTIPAKKLEASFPVFGLLGTLSNNNEANLFEGAFPAVPSTTPTLTVDNRKPHGVFWFKVMLEGVEYDIAYHYYSPGVPLSIASGNLPQGTVFRPAVPTPAGPNVTGGNNGTPPTGQTATGTGIGTNPPVGGNAGGTATGGNVVDGNTFLKGLTPSGTVSPGTGTPGNNTPGVNMSGPNSPTNVSSITGLPGGGGSGGGHGGNNLPGAGGTECCRPVPAVVHTLTLQAPEYLAVAGEEIRVDVWLLRSRDVANMNWTLRYDPQVIRFIEPAERGNLLNSLFEYNPIEPGLIRFGFAQNNAINEPAGTAALLKFAAVGAPGTKSPLTLGVTKANDSSGVDLPVELIHGYVELIAKALEGDCNQDGRTTLQDAQCALRMSVGLIPQRSQVDLDRDAQVTSRDAMMLIQRLIPRP